MADKQTKSQNTDHLDTRDVGNGRNRKTWIDYVGAANSLGYTFTLNDLDDTVLVNGHPISDITEDVILAHLHELNLPNAALAKRAINTSAAEHRFHPVKNYLEKLVWDGKDNIKTLCGFLKDTHPPVVYLDKSERSFIHAALLRWLVGACAKTYQSKSMFNAMLVLVGGQGKGKSSFVRWLCSGLPDNYFEGVIKTDDKDYFGYLATNFIWEVAELGATIRRSDIEALKDYISKREVVWRPSHERHSLRKPTLASMIGTVNPDSPFLSDPTGNRRFVPVELKDIDWNYSKELSPDQIWAQAYYLYRNGESWIMCEEEMNQKREITKKYEVEDTLQEYILKYFDVDKDNKEMWTASTDIYDRLEAFTSFRVSKHGDKTKLASSIKSLDLTGGRKAIGGKKQAAGWYGISIPNS